MLSLLGCELNVRIFASQIKVSDLNIAALIRMVVLPILPLDQFRKQMIREINHYH